MTKVKICGITTPDDAFAAAEAGADAVGMIFYDGSPRRIDIETAQRIVRVLPPFVSKVGVFVNALRAQIDKTVEKVGLDTVQLSGDEAPGYAQSIKSASVIKAIRVAGPGDAALASEYYGTCTAILIDTKLEGAYGGTGRTFDWSLASELMREDTPTIVAGGLTPENVGDVVRKLRPFGVDSSSGVEWEPGVKNHDRVRRFVEEVRRADVEARSL